MNKICSKCCEEKPIEEFYKDSKKKDGLRCWCISCQKEDNRKREPGYNAKRRLYRSLNKEKVRANKKRYYGINKDKILEQNSKWRKTINGRLMSYKKGALRRGFEWNLSNEEFESLWQKKCFYCGCEISTISIDRVDSKKGYIISNVVPCCTQCNIMKLDFSQDEFFLKIKQIYELHKDKIQ